MEEILNKCPLCGGKIEYSALMQYENIHSVLKSGKLSKNRVRKADVGPMECGYMYCKNDKCDFITNTDLEVEGHSEIEIRQENNRYVYEINNYEVKYGR